MPARPVRYFIRIRASGHSNTLGLYHKKNLTVTIYLAPIMSYAVTYFGVRPSEEVLFDIIVSTMIHEDLHSAIRAKGPGATKREHHAISRMMHATNQDWLY